LKPLAPAPDIVAIKTVGGLNKSRDLQVNPITNDETGNARSSDPA